MLASSSGLNNYGAVIAASIAALVTIGNSVWQVRYQLRSKEADWLREIRIPRYAEFVKAARSYRDAVFWAYCEPDQDVLGPPPDPLPALGPAEESFNHELAGVFLVGPPEVARAARYAQYGIWHLRGTLEYDPVDYDTRAADDSLRQFITEARSALSIPGTDLMTMEYREWLRTVLGSDH